MFHELVEFSKGRAAGPCLALARDTQSVRDRLRVLHGLLAERVIPCRACDGKNRRQMRNVVSDCLGKTILQEQLCELDNGGTVDLFAR